MKRYWILALPLISMTLFWACSAPRDSLTWVDYGKVSPDLKHDKILLPKEAESAIISLGSGKYLKIRKTQYGWNQDDTVDFIDSMGFWKDF